MKKDNFVSQEELLALIERVEGRSLKEDDGQVIKVVFEKTRLIEQMAKEGKITSKRQLRRLMAIPRPEKSGE
jgi:hypothetical protein